MSAKTAAQIGPGFLSGALRRQRGIQCAAPIAGSVFRDFNDKGSAAGKFRLISADLGENSLGLGPSALRHG